jgi:CubicO group peptidase (beta-lactamase class C family)
MHSNHVPAALLPLEIGGLPLPGYGFGLGSRVLLDVAQSGAPGSVGEFGWSGAAKTHYWVDPKEELVGLFMTQSMMSFDLPEFDLRALAYQAIDDYGRAPAFRHLSRHQMMIILAPMLEIDRCARRWRLMTNW